jgi:acyl-CoA synthetase (AMP-forming)/AMP-acid ligase II
MIGPPTLFVGMMEVPDFRSRVAHLRVVSCGAMGVTPEFIDTAREAFGATVKRTYGSTEAPTVTTTSWQESAARGRDTDGHSVGDAVIRVVEPGTAATPVGQRGEVLVRGPSCSSATARRIRPRLPSAGGGSPPATSAPSTRGDG